MGVRRVQARCMNELGMKWVECMRKYKHVNGDWQVMNGGNEGGRFGISQQSALTPTGSILASKAQNDATCSVQMTSHACSSLGLEAPGGDCGERGAPPERPAGVGNGLEQPQLLSGEVVTGLTKEKHRLENKRNRKQKQAEQGEVEYMTQHQGNFKIPPAKDGPAVYRGSMCPSGLALYHEAAETLLEYATGGCPVETGRDWTVEMMAAAIERGPHVSAMDPEAMKILAEEVAQKELKGQCRVIKWEDIKKRPPTQLKVSPIAMIPHKSRKFRAILDLSFSLRLENGESIPAVNESSVKTAPKGAIDQLGFSLQRIIHAFAHTNPNDKVFMAKWDIKDGFWRLDAQKDEEWNFAYVLPQEEGKPIKLVIPTSLQMGWIESPPYFCAASETGRDVAVDYVETEIGSLPAHKFLKYSAAGSDFGSLPRRDKNGKLRYLVECYVDDYIALAIPTSQQQLEHVANAVTMGIHDVFPPDDNDEEDAISLKKLKKFEAMWLLHKDILGFTFDGLEKTIWLEKPKRDALLEMLRMWIRKASKGKEGILFVEFQSVISKLRHAFVSIPNGRGLLTPCNQVLRGEPKYIFLHRNDKLLTAIKDCRTLLRESTLAPTKCYELVSKWPDFVGVKDASGHGVGGVIIGENMACIPTVFRFEWPADIKADLNSEHNPKGKITNSDLEMAGLLLLWLIMEEVCDVKSGTHAALFSDNQPTVSWVQRMASKSDGVAGELVRALALRMQASGVSPLTTLHVPGKENAMTDIPSRSFGSEPKWHCKTDADLLDLFNKTFPLPQQNSWTVFSPSNDLCMKVLSVLRMKRMPMDEWRRLPKRGKHTGKIGNPLSHLWEWTLNYRVLPSNSGCGVSQDLQLSSERAIMVEVETSKLARSLALSRPLARRLPWSTK